jgi:hypothetical protein
MIQTGRIRRTRIEICLRATFFTANFIWTGLRLNPALHAYNGLSQGMVVKVKIFLNYTHIFRPYLADSGLCAFYKNKSVTVKGNNSALL